MDRTTEQNDDGFIPSVLIQDEVIQQSNCNSIDIKINFLIQQRIPANQLRSIRRPINLVARTIYKELDFTTLPDQLDESGIQLVQQIDRTKNINPGLQNKEGLHLKSFLDKEQFKCIYNKYDKISQSKNTDRMKSIDTLMDYNWKLFKQFSKYQQIIENQGKISIDSNFQCGNTYYAYMPKQSQKDVYLLLQNDTNTHGYTNWFFFKARNIMKTRITFHILNMVKCTKLFRQGMQISIFSMKRYQNQKIGWFKGGEFISFNQTSFERQNHFQQYYYSLSFQYEFSHQNDQVYFAMNKPYTYTRLCKFLNSFETIDSNDSRLKIQIKTSAYSLSNNIIPVIYINSRQEIQMEQNNKKTILFLARQHPSQTMGSFIIEKVMKYFRQIQNQQTGYLLQNYQIVIIPMINPDGVIYGNSRTNLAGLDLNRRWGQTTIKELTPQTFKIKQIIEQIHRNNQIIFMVDVHGHGKKLNSFIFACKSEQRVKEGSSQLFCYIMQKLQKRFRLSQCTFGITKDKEETIRGQMFKKGVMHLYTLQNSFYGYTDKEANKHFNEVDFNQIAISLIKSIYFTLNPNAKLPQISIEKGQALSFKMKLTFEKIEREFKQQKQDEQILSQSDPDGDILNPQQRVKLFQSAPSNFKKKLRETFSKQRKRYQKTKQSKKVFKINLKEARQKQSSQKLLNTISAPFREKSKIRKISTQIRSNQKQGQGLQYKKGIIFKKAPNTYRKLKQKQEKSDYKKQINEKNQKNINLKNKLLKHDPFQNKMVHTSVIYQYPQQKKYSKLVMHAKTQGGPQLQHNETDFDDNTMNLMQSQIFNKQQLLHLRRQNFQLLLHDSISVQRIGPSKILKTQNKSIKRQTSKTQSQLKRSQPKPCKNQSNFRNTMYSSQKNPQRKYNRFEKFLKSKRERAKHFEQKNCVFYYFPAV